jgi:hypothetical protein
MGKVVGTSTLIRVRTAANTSSCMYSSKQRETLEQRFVSHSMVTSECEVGEKFGTPGEDGGITASEVPPLVLGTGLVALVVVATEDGLVLAEDVRDDLKGATEVGCWRVDPFDVRSAEPVFGCLLAEDEVGHIAPQQGVNVPSLSTHGACWNGKVHHRTRVMEVVIDHSDGRSEGVDCFGATEGARVECCHGLGRCLGQRHAVALSDR